LFPPTIDNISGQNCPVFITGAPRSGSSWVGEVLSSCDATRYVYEPFNHRWLPALRDHLPHFSYIDGQSELPSLVQQQAQRAFQGKQGWKQITRAAYRGYLSAAVRPANTVIIKDPTASLMTEWIAKQFNAQVLCIMRHPCGFASSLDALDWKLNVGNLLRQKDLMREHLEPFRGVLIRARNDKWLTRGAIWAAVHKVFTGQLASHPEWHLYRYEDICDDPMGQFTSMMEKLGLESGKNTREKIHALSTSKRDDSGSTRRNSRTMPGIWKQRMSQGEIDAVMDIVKEFELDYY